MAVDGTGRAVQWVIVCKQSVRISWCNSLFFITAVQLQLHCALALVVVAENIIPAWSVLKIVGVLFSTILWQLKVSKRVLKSVSWHAVVLQRIQFGIHFYVALGAELLLFSSMLYVQQNCRVHEHKYN